MLIQKFEEQVKKTPAGIAVKTEKRSFSYEELNRYASSIAGLIKRHWPKNASKQEHEEHDLKNPGNIGLYLEHGVDMIAAILGTLKAGKAYVPISPDYPQKRISYMMNHSEAALVITNSYCAKKAEEIASVNNIPLLNIDQTREPEVISREDANREISGERLAYIMYTSGSTGKPKGVMQNHENVLYYIENWTRRFSITHRDRMTLFSSFCHDGSGQDMFGALLNGATLYPYDVRTREGDVSLTRFLLEEEITIWHSVPSLYNFFVKTLTGEERFDSLRYILLGGEPFRGYEIEMFKKHFSQSILANVYGQTESSVDSIWTIAASDTIKRLIIGQPLDNTQIFVIDGEGNEVEVFETGEILIACPHITPGYWRDDETTKKTFCQDPGIGRLYYTGDLGRLLPDGNIEFMGRKDFQVKIRGFRVEIGEIETSLLQMGNMREAVVVPKESDPPATYLCAFIVAEKELEVTELREFLSRELPDYMIPTSFVQLDRMPLTQSGKIDRKALSKLDKEPKKLNVTYAAPQTSMERIAANTWKEVLHLEQVGINDNFFDLGGNSFDIIKINIKLSELLKWEIPMVKMFEFPTIGALADYLNRQETKTGTKPPALRRVQKINKREAGIAVIGMAGRFPGAQNIDEFWNNIINGVESISFFSNRELEQGSVDPQSLQDPDYVRANGVLADIEYFDAAFFKYAPNEAEMMDPQLRLLHECSWEALENAGYNPDAYDGYIGVYAGNAPNQYWVALTYLNRTQTNALDTIFLNQNYSTKVSYKLNLRGPSVIVQTACSTSLVAIHFACRGLIDGECDMALAGGVSITLPDRGGYLYQEGMILSRDGHCRTFDANAGGTIFANGVGMVVLKPLEDALADGDTIDAVIKGSAINNDGNRKVGITAPSVEGEAEVIAAARDMAGLEPESIGYIETHGTGTVLGDPVEIEALKLAFNTKKTNYCAIGSVKTNVGHLNSAAGVAGFIKTVLALKHEMIPPSLHFDTPNPGIDFENSPFFVNTKLMEWKRNGQPLRAGVNAFGIGGTNAHVVLEEAPGISGSVGQWVIEPVKKTSGGTRGLAPLSDRQYQLILLSAKTPTALEKMTENLVNFLTGNRVNPANPINPGPILADAAYTLQVGRKAFKYRRMLVCSRPDELPDIVSPPVFAAEEGDKPVVFMFAGQGTQYVDMGWDLYRTEPVFRQEMDRCFEILKPLTDYDLKEILYPSAGGHGSYRSYKSNIPPINQTEIAQPLLFALEYALAKLLMEWGIRPTAMIGYSFGEYTAACISGVISLEDALEIITTRGELMRKTPAGAMLSVPLPEKEIKPILSNYPGISLSIVNDPTCIVCGTPEAVKTFERDMKKRRLICGRVNTSHAVHSPLMNPIREEFEKRIGKFTLKPPQISYLSNVSGDWLSAEEAVNPRYWGKHLCSTARFSDGIKKLLKEDNAVFIEIGPGRVLGNLVRQHPDNKTGQMVLNLVPHQEEKLADDYYLLKRIGQLWLYGLDIDGVCFYGKEKRQRIHLPAYPFEKQRFWLEGDPLKIGKEKSIQEAASGKKPDIADWFYIPSWKPSAIPGQTTDRPMEKMNWLIFTDTCEIGYQLSQKLKQLGHEVLTVKPGSGFVKHGHEYAINPGKDEDYNALMGECRAMEKIPRKILHLWNITGPPAGKEAHDVEDAIIMQERGYYSLLSIARAIGKQNINDEIEITVITNQMQGVTGDDLHYPQKATILGPLQVIPREYFNIDCRSIDIENPEPGTEMVEVLLTELFTGSRDPVVALRNNRRWVKTFEAKRLEKPVNKLPRLKDGGVYLLTGGLGGIGLVLAKYLAETVKARLILTGRTPLPPKQQWTDWLLSRDPEDEISIKIRTIRELEALGAEVLIFSADVTDRENMREVISLSEKQLGKINGVIHAAGTPDGTIIQRRTKEMSQRTLAPKVTGTLVLDTILKDRELDFFILCSSIASVTAPGGEVAYCAANIFLDHFARYKSAKENSFTLSINWDVWQQVGMAPRAVKKANARGTMPGMGENPTPAQSQQESRPNPLKDAMLPAEGVDAFTRILTQDRLYQVLVSTTDFHTRLRQVRKFTEAFHRQHFQEETPSLPKHSRPELSSAYAPPGTDVEHRLAEIWQELLGIDKVGIHDDFFELGGDSLKAVTFAGKIYKKINIEVPLPEFFDRPTIKKLAEYIEIKNKKTGFHSIEPAEEKEYYVLSSAQKRLYILHALERQSIGYNFPSVVSLEGNIETQSLENTIQRLIKRHEALRTSFAVANGEPVQRIHDRVDFKLEVYDRGEKHIQRFLRPFDLSLPPLIRVGLIREGSKKHILMVDIHHIVYDGTSMAIFFKELMSLYEGKELLPLRIQYKDYAQWRNSHPMLTEKENQEAYWLDVFAGEIPVINLPLDFARPPTQDFNGRRLEFVLEENRANSLKNMAKEEGVTLYMVLLAIINVLLMKLGSQEDIVVGTPLAGRKHPDQEQIIGMFINTLALRNYPTNDKTFSEFLAEIKERTLNAFENQDYPFEELVEKVKVRRDVSRNPIFDVMFRLNNFEAPGGGIKETEIRGLKLSTYHFDPHTSIFDLNFGCWEYGDKLLFTVDYCTALFKVETIERIINYFQQIVKALQEEENPAKKLSDIEIISRQEKSRLLHDFNRTKTGYPKDKTIHKLFEEQAARTPDHVALAGLRQTHEKHNHMSHMAYMSYRELNQKSNQLAHSLQEKGVKPGTIAAILVNRTIRMMVGLLGILKTGAAYLPLDPEYPEKRIEYILANSNAEVLVVDDNSCASWLSFAPKVFVNLSEARHFKFYPSTLLPFYPSQSSNPAYVIYTSGSTGNPKGVMVQHKNAVNFITGMTTAIDFSPGKAILAVTTISFDIFFLETLLPITRGLKVVMADEDRQKDPALLEQLLLNHQVNMVQFTPSRLQLLLNLRGNLQGLAGAAELMVGGEAFPSSLLEKVKEHFPGKIYNMYGPTETTIWSAVKELTHALAGEITIGTPIANTRVYIVDRNHHPQPLGVAGELLIGGDGVASGYLNNPDLTGEKFIFNRHYRSNKSYKSNILYRTGDLARWWVNGEIEFLGRVDHQVKIRGYRVELEEIEEQLLKHEHLKEAVVVVKTNPGGEKSLCAYLLPDTTASTSPPNSADLREMLANKLPAYMIPSYFVMLEKMPLTPNGKIDRKALPEPTLSRSHPETGGTFVEPTTDNEKIIARIWKELLLVEEVGIYENFFDLGGNSMNVIRLNWELKETFGIDIPVALLFRNLTIDFLSKYLGQEEMKTKNREKHIEALDRGQDTLMDTVSKLIVE